MLEPRPPRADPRLLVVDVGRTSVHVAVADAWEVRALDALPRSPRALTLALWRLVVKTRPSHVMIRRDPAARPWPGYAPLARLALERGLPLGCLADDECRALLARTPVYAEIATTYPEVRHLIHRARDPRIATLRLAVGALITCSLPPRRYVPGLPPRTPSRVAS